MDTFPPTYDFPSDTDDGTVYTDIPVDPASLPPNPDPDTDALLEPFLLSDEEMEDEEEPEEESEEDSGEEPLMHRTSDDDMAVADPTDEESSDSFPSDDEESSDSFPSDDDESDPGPDSLTTPAPTAPPSVLAMAPPSTAPHYFPPRNGGPRMVHTARKRVHLPSADHASTSQALPPPPPHPRNGYEQPIMTTSHAPSSPRDGTRAMGNQTRESERQVTVLQGPERSDGVDVRAYPPNRFLDIVDRRIYDMEWHFAEQVRELRHREEADRAEILSLRRRLLALEDHLRGLHRR